MDLEIIPPPGALTVGTLTLTPGELFETIPLNPGGINAFVDANLPKSMQRAAPADPELSRFAETIAKQAAEELGMSGTIGLSWFTCEQSTRPTHWLDSAHTVGAHSRLDGFATAYQTERPSIWLRLDGRQVPAAELAHLIRHEIAHLYLEIRGMLSGPVHEALADTFADGGMPALEGAFGLGDSPPALSPGNASSTVIIDGQSNMFKIAATGTASVAVTADGTRYASAVSFPALGALGATPAHQCYVGAGGGAVHLGYSANGVFLGPAFTAGSNYGNNVMQFLATTTNVSFYCDLDGSSYARVTIEGAIYGSGGQTFAGRYYILKEAAI